MRACRVQLGLLNPILHNVQKGARALEGKRVYRSKQYIVIRSWLWFCGFSALGAVAIGNVMQNSNTSIAK